VELLNDGFTILMVIENLIKYLAMNKLYFKDTWNIFDGVILLISIVSIGLYHAPAL
jgi:hypothetical protein